MEKLEQPRDFDSILQNNQSFLLFKHSLTCPISNNAFLEFQQFTESNPEFSAYYLAVQESRPLSNYIADYFSIKHETPQIFYIHNGEVKWHASHWNIRKEEIDRVLQEELDSV
ncbi:bacillithiol system redox-active protein YtxJ [Fervidibacillus halotolerans]|uniref:Bacillithiol system redox-active protein YtxJ n=1 Tax=Fervidibacillus halotolerans TaxID=2980027 RepID=A0A9E8LXX9_9BACI|nr:bacillithiol system redox-active protein YtxJ [Fervidibacillus halotolerans]WAA11740.1 bacillithiol system redox-active protein YtxJ [Fervidibacillus halotolerans]